MFNTGYYNIINVLSEYYIIKMYFTKLCVICQHYIFVCRHIITIIYIAANTVSDYDNPKTVVCEVKNDKLP